MMRQPQKIACNQPMRQLNMHSRGFIGRGRGVMWAWNSLIYVFPHNDILQVPNMLIGLVVLSSLSHMDTTTIILYVHMTEVQIYNAMDLSQQFSNHDT
jgi:hypothetical protein